MKLDTDTFLKMFIPVVLAVLAAAVLFTVPFMLVQNNNRQARLEIRLDAYIKEVDARLNGFESGNFTAEDFVRYVTRANGLPDTMRASIRAGLDIPPPEVQQGLADLDSLKQVIHRLGSRLDSLGTF